MSDVPNLIREVERLKVDPGKTVLWALGGAGFVVKSAEALIYIDPFFGIWEEMVNEWTRAIPIPGSAEDIRHVDAVISTHEHIDHCHNGTLVPVSRNTDALFIGPQRSIDLALSWDYPAQRLVPLSCHQSVQVKDTRITAMPSYDPISAAPPLTYILETPGGTIFHGGDSLYFDGFVECGVKWSIDLALISYATNPLNAVLYMSAYEVARAAHDLKTRCLVPMHWDMWKQYLADPKLVEVVVKRMFPQIQVRVVPQGNSIVLPL
ncbi:MAG: MBL fold metallo-hydrolase [Chloroflexi bacterium]|nr:MBL fold metallo-hydrolase [Chloroflexota bacterium]